MAKLRIGTPVFRHWFNFSIRRNRLSTFICLFLIAVISNGITSLLIYYHWDGNMEELFELPVQLQIIAFVNLIQLYFTTTFCAQRLRDIGIKGMWLLPVALIFAATLLLYILRETFLPLGFTSLINDNLVGLLSFVFLLLLNTYLALMITLFIPGDKGPNFFGEDPLGHKVEYGPKAPLANLQPLDTK